MNTSIINILVISAPSGAGKTTLISQMSKKHRFRYSISHTTRSPRAHEVNGQHYYFITSEEFNTLRSCGHFMETTYIHGHQYGTSWDNFTSVTHPEEWLLLDLDIHGLMALREKMHDIVSVFILPPSMDSLRDRILIRQPDIRSDEIESRLLAARQEIERVFEYDYSIFNEQIDQATEELSMILQTEQLKNKRRKLFLESFLF